MPRTAVSGVRATAETACWSEAVGSAVSNWPNNSKTAYVRPTSSGATAVIVPPFLRISKLSGGAPETRATTRVASSGRLTLVTAEPRFARTRSHTETAFRTGAPVAGSRYNETGAPTAAKPRIDKDAMTIAGSSPVLSGDIRIEPAPESG